MANGCLAAALGIGHSFTADRLTTGLAKLLDALPTMMLPFCNRL